jgi:hypothetical protein
MGTRRSGGRPSWTRDEWIGAAITGCVGSLSLAVGAFEQNPALGLAGLVVLAAIPLVPSMRREPRRRAPG